MRMTQIYSVFPGMGKTHLFNYVKEKGLDLKIADSDSSQFSWVDVDGKRERNPEFPNNYIDHIKSLIGEVDIILTSTHKEVLQALNTSGLGSIMVFPDIGLKDVYIERYRNRGSDESFINLMNQNWEMFIDSMIQNKNFPRIQVREGDRFLSDVLSTRFKIIKE